MAFVKVERPMSMIEESFMVSGDFGLEMAILWLEMRDFGLEMRDSGLESSILFLWVRKMFFAEFYFTYSTRRSLWPLEKRRNYEGPKAMGIILLPVNDESIGYRFKHRSWVYRFGLKTLILAKLARLY